MSGYGDELECLNRAATSGAENPVISPVATAVVEMAVEAIEQLTAKVRQLNEEKAELLGAVGVLLDSHARMDPHHEDLCSVCKLARRAIAKAEGKP